MTHIKAYVESGVVLSKTSRLYQSKDGSVFIDAIEAARCLTAPFRYDAHDQQSGLRVRTEKLVLHFYMYLE